MFEIQHYWCQSLIKFEDESSELVRKMEIRYPPLEFSPKEISAVDQSFIWEKVLKSSDRNLVQGKTRGKRGKGGIDFHSGKNILLCGILKGFWYCALYDVRKNDQIYDLHPPSLLSAKKENISIVWKQTCDKFKKYPPLSPLLCGRHKYMVPREKLIFILYRYYFFLSFTNSINNSLLNSITLGQDDL